MAAPSDADVTPPVPRSAGDIDALVRGLVAAGDVDLAATRTLEHFGPELYGFLRAIAQNDDLAAEAFAIASEQVWRNLAGFRWSASLRTWAYQVFRNALTKLRADPRRRPARNLPLSIATSFAQIQRSVTAPYQRTEVKQAMRALREALDPLDHEILILRLDRAMSWKDIARALGEPDDAAAVIEQRAASFRKRFERAKTQLRELAIKHGLLPGA